MGKEEGGKGPRRKGSEIHPSDPPALALSSEYSIATYQLILSISPLKTQSDESKPCRTKSPHSISQQLLAISTVSHREYVATVILILVSKYAAEGRERGTLSELAIFNPTFPEAASSGLGFDLVDLLGAIQ